jgi:hypothetical protein
VSRSERAALLSALVVLLIHLAKWDAQPHRRSRSWRATVEEQRRRVARIVGDRPSLGNQLPDFTARAWRRARIVAAEETQLPLKRFPVDNPYLWSMMLDAPMEEP